MKPSGASLDRSTPAAPFAGPGSSLSAAEPSPGAAVSSPRPSATPSSGRAIWTRSGAFARCVAIAVLALIGGTLSLSLAGCHRQTTGPGKSQVAEAPAKPPVPVVTATVVREPVARNLVQNGLIIARSQINILPRTTGRILELRAMEGDRVKAGQILARLDTPELNWQLAQQKSMLLSSQANLDLARDNLIRLQELAREGVVSQQQLKAAEAQEKVAAAQVRQSKASIALMETQLANSVITSPITGTVVARALDVGAMALPSTPIMTIAQAGAFQVKLQVPERELPLIREGGRLYVTSVALPGERFPARIREISEMLDPQTRLIPVKADLERNGRLKIGMNVKATLVGRPHLGLVVPTRAILTDGAEQIVYVAERDQERWIARRVAIKTGVRTPERTEVVSGLASGDQVLVEGASFVRDGDAIAISPAREREAAEEAVNKALAMLGTAAEQPATADADNGENAPKPLRASKAASRAKASNPADGGNAAKTVTANATTNAPAKKSGNPQRASGAAPGAPKR